MEPVNKHTVLKKVRENREWRGFIAPSNVNSYHIDGGWHIGHEITIRKDNFHYFVWNGKESQELESYLNNFKHYNCNSELGYRIRFWQA